MADLAVLTRNFKNHLDPALAGGAPVTFYSNVLWKTVEEAHIAGKRVVIYFVVSDDPGQVTYQANLVDIVIPPVKDTQRLEQLLKHAPDHAARAEIDNGSAKTLYSVAHVKKVVPAFSQTELLKRSDGKPVSKDYERSYCIVDPYE
jgi:hypothetical protein